MSKLKKIVAIIFAVTSGISFASTTVEPSQSESIIIPTNQNTWHIGVSALYLQPSLGGNGLGYSSYSNYGFDYFSNRIEVNGATNQLSNVQPDREWASQVDVSYGFGSGNDVDANWYHLDNNTSEVLPRGTLFAGSAPSLYAGQLNINTTWDAINVGVGQRINFGETKLVRLHVGLQGAEVAAK
jgi:hypothetical protein